VLRAQAQQRDRVRRRDERVSDDPLVAERHPGHRITVYQREQHLTLELRRVIQRGEPASDVSLVCTRRSQLDPWRVSNLCAERARAPPRCRPPEVGYVGSRRKRVDRGCHLTAPLIRTEELSA
jgi:hypothetical protein